MLESGIAHTLDSMSNLSHHYSLRSPMGGVAQLFQGLHRTFWRQFALGLALMLWVWAGLPSAAIARTQTPASSSIQPYIDGVVDRVTEFTLDNGMRFIVLERHQAPVVSFMTYVDVGAAEEAEGKTGEAHFLEHLAFKGTTQIGTKDYALEKPLLDQLDALFQQIKVASDAGDEAEVAKLQAEFADVQAKAAELVEQNQYGQIVEQAGGVGLNATTSADATRYFYSFPSNKLELWMSLESERFLDPVFREFYEERDVILEERRMRTDNSPIGKMIEQFLETALPGHPYGRPIIGYEDDIRNLSRDDIRRFFETYYTPSNIIVSVVGDVDPDRVKQLAQTYFGRFQSGAEIPTIEAAAPTQTEPREVVLEFPSEPWYLEGYQRPSIDSPDSVIYGMIASLLTSGRTSRLYQSLVEQKQVSLSIDAYSNFPGNRLSNIMLIYALTAPGHTVDEIAAALDAELVRLKSEPIPTEELERVKTQAKAEVLRSLASNQGMASLLPEYEAKTGSWRNLFEDLKKIDAVTSDDIQRVAQALFQPTNLTVGKLLPPDSTP